MPLLLNDQPRSRPPVPRIMPSPPPGWPSWEAVMREAVREASLAAAAHEIPVGAVVIAPDGTLIGKGHNRPRTKNDPTAHAEVAAIREAAARLGNYRLTGCCLAVTLEPCLMCVGAMVHARLGGVVFGAYDPRTGAATSCIDGFDLPFHNHTTWQAGGILETECALLLQDFFSARR